MSDQLRSNLITTLMILIVLGTAYGYVADKPSRKVVMSKAQFDQTIQQAVQQARIEGAREAFTAAQVDSECILGWSVRPGAKAKGPM